MNKEEFIQFYAKHNKISINDAKDEINRFLDTMTAGLVEDGSVKLTGYMSLKVNKREAGMARNPKTGAQVPTEERNTVSFSSGKLLKDRINAPLKNSKKEKKATPESGNGKKKLLKKKK